jgi:hypothetical protein
MWQKNIYQFIMCVLLFWIRSNLCTYTKWFCICSRCTWCRTFYSLPFFILSMLFLLWFRHIMLLPCIVKSPDAEHFIQSSLSVRLNFTFQSTSQPKKLGNRPRGSWPAWSYHRLFSRPWMSNPLRLFLVKARVPVRWSIGVATHMIEAKQFWEWCVAYDS